MQGGHENQHMYISMHTLYSFRRSKYKASGVDPVIPSRVRPLYRMGGAGLDVTVITSAPVEWARHWAQL